MPTYRITDEDYPVKIELPELVHGADWGWSFQLMEDDNVTPINTTGYTCSITIKAGPNGEIYDTLALSDGITMTAAQGLFAILLDDAVVDTYDWNTAIMTVIVTDNLGGKTPYFIADLKFAA